MRMTKKELEGMFCRLARASNKSTEKSLYGWKLDYVACYGGYVIEDLSVDGGINHPFGARRRNAKEMYYSMWMAAQALEQFKYEQRHRKV